MRDIVSYRMTTSWARVLLGSVLALGLLLTPRLCSAVTTDLPSIVNGVASQTLNPGDAARLDCRVRDKGTFTIFWKQRFNGVFFELTREESILARNPVEGLYPNNKTKYELEKTVNADLSLTYTLTINRLHGLDAGLYECAVVKLQGGTPTTIAENGTLTLRGISDGPKIVNTIGTVKGRVNGSAQLTCLVAYKENHLVKWRRLPSNVDITSDGSIIIANNPSVDGIAKYQVIMRTSVTGIQFDLTINRLSVADGGQYQCYVQTSQPPFPSQTGQLEIGVPPVITTTTQLNMTVQTGQSVTLDCTATGTPDPPVFWSRVDGAYLPNGEVRHEGQTLVISNMQKEKRGLYHCQAANGVYPDAALRFRVLVRFPPTASPIRGTVRQAQGRLASLECVMEGYPDIVPTWYKMSGNSKVPVTQGDNYDIMHTEGDGVTAGLNYNRFILNIQKVTSADFGQYRCEAVSGTDTAYGVITLTESDKCVGSGCFNPVTRDPVTQTQGHTKCVGSHCTGGSGRLHSFTPLLIGPLLMSFCL